MNTLLLRLFFNAVGLFLIAQYIRGIQVDGLYPAIVAALVLGILNMFIRPILLILTFPITVLTLGLFSFVVNATIFWFAASFLDGFAVDGFVPALLGSLSMSIINTIGSRWIGGEKSKVVYRKIRK